MPPLAKIAAIAATVAGFALYAASFEPFGVAEFAYVFAALFYVAARRGGLSSKAWLAVSAAGSWCAWCAILAWLRFVYPPAGAVFLAGLSAVLGLFMLAWMWMLFKFAPRDGSPFASRMARILFLASAWVVLEWVRSFLFTGFPWMLLAHSQWLRPAVIQPAEIGGPYIISFVLIFFNMGLGEFVCRTWAWHKSRVSGGARASGAGRFSPEFYIGAGMVMACLFMYISNMPRVGAMRREFRAGMVQTDFAGILNWSSELGMRNLDTLRRLTMELKKARVDVVLWPESSTPPQWPVIGTPGVREWVEAAARDAGAPILMGNGAYYPGPGGGWEGSTRYNAAFFVSEKTGLCEKFYAKQKLVPFGEYKPAWCFFLDSGVVPVGGMTPGAGPVVLEGEIAGRKWKIAPVICYEDVFPQIGRAAANAGADMLFVCTNDSWYGREGGAWQHAAHSAFMAVSTRRPVLRSSINGLSGVFDQYGRLVPAFALRNVGGGIFDGSGEAREVLDLTDPEGMPVSESTLRRARGGPLADDSGSIYFRGAGYADVPTYSNFDGVQTFYMRFGDWFPAACAVYMLAAVFLRKKILTNPAKCG